MLRANLTSFRRLAAASLWIGLATELFWAMVFLILGTYLIWGFTTGFLKLDKIQQEKNLKRVKPIFNYLSIFLIIFTFVFLAELASCRGVSVVSALVFGLFAAPFAYFWGQILIPVANFFIGILPSSRPNPRTEKIFDFVDSRLPNPFLGVPFSPPRFPLA